MALSTEMRVQYSAVESSASGLSVGRVEIWPPGRISGREANDLIVNSGFDITIVRAGVEDVRLAAQLGVENFTSFQADTLLYFEISIEDLEDKVISSDLKRLTREDRLLTDSLVKNIFSGYQNHYSANPALVDIDVVAAYQQWTRSSLDLSNRVAYLFAVPDSNPCGLCVVDVEHPFFDEIILAGILPEQQGRGRYSNMVQEVIRRARRSGKQSLVISTQAANVKVMRSWCRMGFLPTIALNTFHVVRKEILEMSLRDLFNSLGTER